MGFRLKVVAFALGIVWLLAACGGQDGGPSLDAGADAAIEPRDAAQETSEDASLPVQDAATFRDAGEPSDANPNPPDAAIAVDAGEAIDASHLEPDAGEAIDASAAADVGQAQPDAAGLRDAGPSAGDAGGAAADGGDPHAGADKLEYCGGAPSLPQGRSLTVMLNGTAIDFAGGYFWGIYSPETSQYWGDSTFTWMSTDGQYYLELMVHQGFSGSCPVTLSLPNDEVVWNLYDTAQPPVINLFSSDLGATGALTLDAYDLAGGACSVSVGCESCHLVWGSDEADIDGSSVESCQ